MKLYPDCIPCQVEVRRRDIGKLISNPDLEIILTCSVCKLLHDLVRRGFKTAPEIATVLYRFIRKETGVDDPYYSEKKIANRRGLELYYKLRRIVEAQDEVSQKVNLAVKIALLGNSIDFGVAGYTPPPAEELIKELSQMSVIGDFPVFRGKRIVYLMDNAGEAALDKILAEVLIELGNEVIGVVKSGPFQNDVTLDDVEDLRLNESFTKVIGSGTDAASIFLNEISQEVKEALLTADVIIAKGMAHFEYITEIEDLLRKPVYYLMKVKCRPVSIESKAPLGSYVVLGRVKV